MYLENLDFSGIGPCTKTIALDDVYGLCILNIAF